MKPVETPFTNCVFKLEGGTVENNLPAERTVDYENRPCIVTMWEPTEQERRQISQGTLIRLVVWGFSHPAVAVGAGRDFMIDVEEEDEMQRDLTVKPDLSLYLGKRVVAIVRGEQPHEWGIKMQGEVEIRNRDERETVVPIGLVGLVFSSMSLSLHDTVMHFTGPNNELEKFSFNPVKYGIYDPGYGSEVLPQWPEELEAAGNVPEGMEASGEASAEWPERRARLEQERDARTQSDAQEFLKED